MQEFNRSYKNTTFMAVRFGNVLGSSGSVIPIFQEQIKNGGPVTITDPKIKRYFMSIPEAAQLILQAGALGEGGEIFVLDMGKPIKIIDLARQVISLAGKTPDKDIKIKTALSVFKVFFIKNIKLPPNLNVIFYLNNMIKFKHIYYIIVNN